MRIPSKHSRATLGLIVALLAGPSVAAAESKSGALVPPPTARPADSVVLWDRIAVDGEHAQEIQAQVTAFDGKTLVAGGRRFAVALAGDSVFDAYARPMSLGKALGEHPKGLCALVQYVPARLSALGADTVTGVVLLVSERGTLLERCPAEEARR